MNNQILLGLVTIGLVASVVGVGTYAYFSDTETSTGNTMTAGVLDLKVNDGDLDDGTAKLDLTISDMKPSYTIYTDPITLRVVDNPARIYKKILASPETCTGGTHPEPELSVDPDDSINDFYSVTWVDLEMLLPTGEWVTLIPDGEVLIGDLSDAWIYLGTVDAQGMLDDGYPTEITIKQSFHMDSRAGNEYQGDVCEFTEVFRAEQTNAPYIGSCEEQVEEPVPGDVCKELY